MDFFLQLTLLHKNGRTLVIFKLAKYVFHFIRVEYNHIAHASFPIDQYPLSRIRLELHKIDMPEVLICKPEFVPPVDLVLSTSKADQPHAYTLIRLRFDMPFPRFKWSNTLVVRLALTTRPVPGAFMMA